MYSVKDDNDAAIPYKERHTYSRHRTISAAQKAVQREQRVVQLQPGGQSRYLKRIIIDNKTGQPADWESYTNPKD